MKELASPGTLLEEVAVAWGWRGLIPAEIIAQNAFGNVIVKATDGRYWRITLEELRHEVVADDDDQFATLSGNTDFIADWEMSRLVDIAREKCGPLTEGHCYCFKLPGVLGGQYAAKNIGTIPRVEVIGFSGHLAEQIRGLPDGTNIQLQIVD